MRQSEAAIGEWARRNLRPEDAERVAQDLVQADECERALAGLSELGIAALAEFGAECPHIFEDRLVPGPASKRPAALR